MTRTSERLVSEYLRRLERELADLPTARRGEIIEEISEHIEEARAGGLDDEASVRSVLDRLGDPADIAAEAHERFGVRPRRPFTQTTTGRVGLAAIATVAAIGTIVVAFAVLAWVELVPATGDPDRVPVRTETDASVADTRAGEGRVSVADVRGDEEPWMLHSFCRPGVFTVDFRQGSVAVSGRRHGAVARASLRDIAISCGDPARRKIGRTGELFSDAGLRGPRYGATQLTCRVDEELIEVSVNPIWGDSERDGAVGSALGFATHDRRIVVSASVKRDEFTGKVWSRIWYAPSYCTAT